MHLVITDSGLGGLSICAGIEKALREATPGAEARLTYVNAWPEQGLGYNDLPDMSARARVFDRALRRIAGLRPDAILIACNTLSIVYEHTAFRRDAPVAVQGIVTAGVDLFYEALTARPTSSIVLLGTRTTIEAGVHRDALLARGVAPGRVSAASCHGLAAAIEQGADGPATIALVETCAERAGETVQGGDPLYAGLCCTHYGFVADRICAALASRTGREVAPLDPNGRLVRDLTSRMIGRATATGVGRVSVEVVSKVSLNDQQRLGMAELIEPESPATATALRTYRRMPDLFQESA